MADGTSLEDLERGNVPEVTADAAKMAEIMNLVNASGGAEAQSAPAPQPQMMQAMPPQMNMHPMHMGGGGMPPHFMQQQQQQRYIAVDDDEYKPRKKNMWSNISSYIRDPIIVTTLLFVLMLPMLHTQLAKVAGWAFAVGGQLSWLGLIAISIIGGIGFGLVRGAANLAGL